jgi:predicted RNA-binding Zn-ribbon protein involved in translation (DUF1610 family)
LVDAVNPFFARCKCGYRKTIDIHDAFGGRDPSDFYPALCVYCDEVIPLDHDATPWQCPECRRSQIVSYRDPKLVSQIIRMKAQNWFAHDHEIHQLPKRERQLLLQKELKASWRDILSCCVIPPYTHFCPKCRSFRMEFVDEGGRAD